MYVHIYIYIHIHTYIDKCYTKLLENTEHHIYIYIYIYKHVAPQMHVGLNTYVGLVRQQHIQHKPTQKDREREGENNNTHIHTPIPIHSHSLFLQPLKRPFLL